MDPYDEQRLTDEVIYLHSLWHRGPPPKSTFTDSSNGVLHQHSKRTQFKRRWLKPSAQRGNRNNTNQEAQCSTVSIQDPGKEWPKPNNVAPISAWPTRNAHSNSQLSWHCTESGREWPCNPSPDASTHTSALPIVTTQQNSQSISISPQQQARLVANRAQAKALKAAKVFFRSNNSDGDEEDDDDHLRDSDHDDSEIEENDDPHDSTEEGCGVAKYRFFFKVFADDSEFRDYYRKNCQNGDFRCLVCGGIGMKKATKRFKDCVALIQHSIANTKKRRAHRAYGKAISEVLGWDIHKLPTIVSELSANRDVSSAGTSEVEAQVMVFFFFFKLYRMYI